jgi:multidrug efflux pump subunit AcrB
MMKELSSLPGIVDVRLAQVPRTPDIHVNVDRTLASLVGVTQRDVASDLLISLSSSNQTAPNFWLDNRVGVQYNIFVQTPQYNLNTMNDLENTPIVAASSVTQPQNAQLLVNLASTERGFSPTNITHYNIRPTFDVQMSVQGVDLGTAGDEIRGVVDKYRGQLNGASKMNLLGQLQSMHDSFSGLGYGLIFAVVLVYLLMVINFQSWLDPLIILMALPGAVAGILWMLWASQTTISVPALMGAIMSIGVATANSILMITFANDQREVGMNARDAALSAGLTRLRPVMMTALAMIIGMLPMAMGLGEGGEQNAPLGRAVIGGLAMATFATLIFVPVVYSLLRGKAREMKVEKELM